MRSKKMQLIHARGEEAVGLVKRFPVTLIAMSECRGRHKKLDCLIFDFGLGERLLLQSTPTDIDDEFEIDILTFKLVDRDIRGEKPVPIGETVIHRIERITTDYEGQRITVGIRLVNAAESLDIIGGDVLASLAVYGWGFPESDQQSAYPLSEYSYEPW